MVKYKVEKTTEAFPRIQQKMEEARKKIDLPGREIYILQKIMLNAKNSWDVCHAIWGEALRWEDVKEYSELEYLYDKLYAYRDNNDAYFAQTVETVEDAEIDGWHEERMFYILEKNEIPEWEEYEILKISPFYRDRYSYLVTDKQEYKKIIDMFPEFSFDEISK